MIIFHESGEGEGEEGQAVEGVEGCYVPEQVRLQRVTGEECASSVHADGAKTDHPKHNLANCLSPMESRLTEIMQAFTVSYQMSGGWRWEPSVMQLAHCWRLCRQNRRAQPFLWGNPELKAGVPCEMEEALTPVGNASHRVQS